MAEPVTMDKIVALCKRRGLIFPASEIYGGIANTYDYGHYGVLLKNNVIGAWWKAMIQERDDIVALDSAIIQHPRAWEASGHLAGFTDPLVDCRACKKRFRADHLQEAARRRGGESGHPLRARPVETAGPPPDRDHRRRGFILMFETSIGPVKDAGSTVYLRPETAQGIFLAFKTTLQYARKKPPLELRRWASRSGTRSRPATLLPHARVRADGDGVLRAAGRGREVARALDGGAHGLYVALGIEREKLRLRPHDADELSHYSSATSDIEYLYPIGWSELEGVANRGDFDLTQHADSREPSWSTWTRRAASATCRT